MSGSNALVINSSLFKEENAKVALSIILFAENDKQYICMNGTVMPVEDLLELVTCNSIKGGISCEAVSGNTYAIPFITPSHLSAAIEFVRRKPN